MTLPKKTLLAIGIAFTGLIGVLYATSSTILLNSVRQAEKQNTRQAVAGGLGAFTQTQEDFSSRYADWSVWDDSYTFVQNGYKKYIESNLGTPKSVTALQVNLVLYIQSSGRIVYGTGFDRIHQKKTPIPEALRPHLSPQDRLLKHPNIRACIEHCLDLLAPKAAEKGLELAYAIAPLTPNTIVGDATRLRQILVNLLSNAVKFTETGEVVVSVASRLCVIS